jgi:nucleoid-associated protein YgaU
LANRWELCLERIQEASAIFQLSGSFGARKSTKTTGKEFLCEGGKTMSDERLEQLKSKYQSVLNLMQQLGVQLQNLHVQDRKLVVRGHAKTNSDSNKIWDQIKLVDKNYQQDLMAEITYAATAAAAAAAVPQSAPRTYTVKAGDSLSKIAKQYYGEASQYTKIFEANRDKLSDPNAIQPGQTLVIP